MKACSYKQQLSDLLRRKEHNDWTGQITARGIMDSRREVVAELYAPGDTTATKTIQLCPVCIANDGGDW